MARLETETCPPNGNAVFRPCQIAQDTARAEEHTGHASHKHTGGNNISEAITVLLPNIWIDPKLRLRPLGQPIQRDVDVVRIEARYRVYAVSRPVSVLSAAAPTSTLLTCIRDLILSTAH